MRFRKPAAELLGTAVLVFFAVGVATLMFGFKLDGESAAAGIVATALAFGLVLLALVYAIGPISGCHVNPAVTIGFLASKRMSLAEAIEYWIAQFVGGILGALALWAVFSGSPHYSRKVTGLGTDGWGAHSMIGINAGGAFAAEVVLTFLFVLVVLAATSHVTSAGFAGLAIGLALTAVHLIGIAITGTSVNPARSLGPALIVGGDALSQVWLFIVAPLVGGVIAAIVWILLISERTEPGAAGQVEPSDLPAAPA
ncbi:MAG TPA: MIP family channel protein [Solirubrobacteraceae bacterium]|jgi:aquaporin Z